MLSDDKQLHPVTLPYGIEVEVVHENRTAPFTDSTWRLLEVWTNNSIYLFNSALRCFDVIDRASFRPVSEHALLGSHLAGGQLRTATGVELSHPFPLPGTEAVFEQQTKGKTVSFSYSSEVVRVVLRLRRVNVEGATNAWGDAQPARGPSAPTSPPPARVSVAPPGPASGPQSGQPALIPSVSPFVDPFDEIPPIE
jgi:hypothetical protein